MRDERWTDLSRLFGAARAAGVRLLACPVWVAILEARERLPAFVEQPTEEEVFTLIESAKVIGSY